MIPFVLSLKVHTYQHLDICQHHPRIFLRSELQDLTDTVRRLRQAITAEFALGRVGRLEDGKVASWEWMKITTETEVNEVCRILKEYVPSPAGVLPDNRSEMSFACRG